MFFRIVALLNGALLAVLRVVSGNFLSAQTTAAAADAAQARGPEGKYRESGKRFSLNRCSCRARYDRINNYFRCINNYFCLAEDSYENAVGD